MKSDTYADFVISSDEIGKHAAGHGMAVTVEGDGKLFHRRCIKMPVNGSGQIRDSILVGELDGVRVYVKPGHIIVTRRDLKL